MCFRFRSFSLPIRFLSSASLPPPATQPSVLPFLPFPVPPYSCFPGARLRSRFLDFPFLSGLISRAFLPGFCTRLSVSFLLPFPDSLPQLFLRCLPCAFAFGLFPFRSAFFRPLLFRFWLLSLCFFLSSFFPASPLSCFSGAASLSFDFLAFPRSF